MKRVIKLSVALIAVISLSAMVFAQDKVDPRKKIQEQMQKSRQLRTKSASTRSSRGSRTGSPVRPQQRSQGMIQQQQLFNHNFTEPLINKSKGDVLTFEITTNAAAKKIIGDTSSDILITRININAPVIFKYFDEIIDIEVDSPGDGETVNMNYLAGSEVWSAGGNNASDPITVS